jgi:hypothetical protein
MRIGGVSSKDNTSDILTKSLQPNLHTRHTTSLFPDRQHKTHTQQESKAEQQESISETHPKHHNMVTYIHIPHDDPRDNTTLRQAHQQWAEYLTQYNKPTPPPPLPITSNEARHNPSLRQARHLWIDYIKQHDRTPTPAPKPEAPRHNQNKRDLKNLHKHTNKSKRGRKQIHQQERPKNKNAHTNQKRQQNTNPTNQTATPTSHSITLKRDQQRSPILVFPAKHSKQDKTKRGSRRSQTSSKISTNPTPVHLSHNVPHGNQSPSPHG